VSVYNASKNALSHPNFKKFLKAGFRFVRSKTRLLVARLQSTATKGTS
jgi:hypothetical protein